MGGLDDHFGDNAELPIDVKAYITEFLDENASDRGDRMKNARLLHDTKSAAPLRMTELPYFKDEHHEIPKYMVADNPEVQSFSRCDACHQDVAKGRFDEDTDCYSWFWPLGRLVRPLPWVTASPMRIRSGSGSRRARYYPWRNCWSVTAKEFQGRLLDLEVEREHGRIVYELEVVDEQGQVHEIYLDAQTGEWLGQELED